MNESLKTVSYVAVAAVALLLGWFSQPRRDDGPKLETSIINEVSDPLSAKRLRLYEYIEDVGVHRDFEVAETNGRWVIPSHENYPADAQDQMAATAASVINLKVLGTVSTDRKSHESFGVIDPDPEKLTPGAKGVGRRIDLEDAKGNKLVSMIIGNEVKGQPGQRYVRMVKNDAVMVVKLDPDKLTTQFDKWIERDLLKINAWEVAGIDLNDYGVARGEVGNGQVVPVKLPVELLHLAYDEQAPMDHWKISDWEKLDRKTGELAKVTIPAGAKLDETKLNEMRTALGELKIVDVKRKPPGLSRDLKAGADFIKDEATVNHLSDLGFMPMMTGPTSIELFSEGGEVVCQMKDGVEYVLRFGHAVAMAGTGAKADDKKDPKAPKDDKADTQLNRYMLITTRFNEKLLEQPTAATPAAGPGEHGGEAPPTGAPPDPTEGAAPDPTKPVEPAKPAEGAKPAEPTKPAEGATPVAPPAGAPPAKAPPAATPPPAPAKPAEKSGAVRGAAKIQQVAYLQDAPAAEPKPADAPAAKKPAAAGDKPAEAKPADDKPTVPAAGDKPAGEAPPAATPPAATPAAGTPPAAPAVEAPPAAPAGEEAGKLDADKLMKELKGREEARKLAEFKKKVEAGQKRSQELNDRFGDWYYIVSDETYQKIHLSSESVIIVPGAIGGGKIPGIPGLEGPTPSEGPPAGLPGGGLPPAP